MTCLDNLLKLSPSFENVGDEIIYIVHNNIWENVNFANIKRVAAVDLKTLYKIINLTFDIKRAFSSGRIFRIL